MKHALKSNGAQKLPKQLIYTFQRLFARLYAVVTSKVFKQPLGSQDPKKVPSKIRSTIIDQLYHHVLLLKKNITRVPMLQLPIWRFPEMGVTPNHPFSDFP